MTQQHINSSSNILKLEVNKDIGDIKIQRYEDVVEDDNFYSPPRRPGVGVVRINVDSNNNNQAAVIIPERNSSFDASEYLQQQQAQQRVQTLVIDDANNDKYSRRALNIEGQTYVQKNEVN